MTILPRHKDVAKSRLKMSNPWHLLAVGFGSGLSPIVPGTMGSLAAIPFWYLMTFLPWQLYSLVVMLGICIGVYLCHQTGERHGCARSRQHCLGRIYRYVDHAHGAADQ
ncbi:phosphatidylglycerophosphatase A [Escherichia coli]|uniref:Phosphatidylglycerophosphatase A n=1 Tax=Escherichia coli TaxID=562 RepID=A0A376LLR8_ECOLX|nr:phosphatidylglycerophosphatase A [Escherichia coli]